MGVASRINREWLETTQLRRMRGGRRMTQMGRTGPSRQPQLAAATLQEDAEVLVERDVGVEDDRVPRYLPGPLHLAQQILAATGEELMIISRCARYTRNAVLATPTPSSPV